MIKPITADKNTSKTKVMSVYSFNKTLLERIDEFKLILDEKQNGTKIRDQWKDFLEISIEPAGWAAIWKISKASCEEFNIKFPCEVYGVVQDTVFDELTDELPC